MNVHLKPVPIKISISNPAQGFYLTANNVTADADGKQLVLKGSDFIRIPSRTEVAAEVCYPDGIQHLSCEVTFSMPTQINLDVIAENDSKIDRRSTFKVRTSFETMVMRMYSLGEMHRRMKIEAPIRVRDLSGGGIGFFSNNIFFEKQQIVVDMSILKPDMHINFQVLRREKPKPRVKEGIRVFRLPFRFSYGARAVRMTAEQERLVMEYIFKTQLSGYQKTKDSEDSWWGMGL
jgi:hypothetical protein